MDYVHNVNFSLDSMKVLLHLGKILQCDVSQYDDMGFRKVTMNPSVTTDSFVLDQYFYFEFLMSHPFLAFSLSH